LRVFSLASTSTTMALAGCKRDEFGIGEVCVGVVCAIASRRDAARRLSPPLPALVLPPQSPEAPLRAQVGTASSSKAAHRDGEHAAARRHRRRHEGAAARGERPLSLLCVVWWELGVPVSDESVAHTS
jgi:hypothetical protein